MMDGRGKSDSPIVPGRSPNKARQGAVEGTEGRGLAKGNPLEQNASRTQGRSSCAPSALERVRQAARKGVILILGNALASSPEARAV